jgi:hypothetical protein
MKTRSKALALALVAGALAPLAQAQIVAPRPTREAVPNAAGTKVTPHSVAKARLVNGQPVIIGEWQRYMGTTSAPDVPDTVYFDCYEADPTGLPTGFCTSGCTQAGNCPAAGPTSRWYFGTGYTNPFHINDMTILPAAANAQSTKTRFAWQWGVGASRDMFVAVFTSETFRDCATGLPATEGDFDGVVYAFAPQAGGGGYFYADNDLSTNPGVFHQMPADGSGAYVIILANAQDPVTGALTIDNTLGTQPMLWGTGEDEVPADGRVGTQTEFNWDDDFPVDAMHTIDECYSSIIGQGVCPDPWGGMMMFMGEAVGGGCYANCDNSTQQPILNVADFTCFLNRFAAGDSYANCDNSTQQPTLNVADFTCFLNSFAAGCP